MASVHGLSARTRVLMPAPMAHISGLLNGVLVSGATGMRTVVQGRWDPEAALRLIEQERVSFDDRPAHVLPRAARGQRVQRRGR